MARYKVDITGINTNELKVLNGEETTLLFKRLQSGDNEFLQLVAKLPWKHNITLM